MSGLSSEGLCGDVDRQFEIDTSSTIDPYYYVRKKKDKGSGNNQLLRLDLYTAICWNDYNKVEALLKRKVNPNALLVNKKFPLECVRDSKIAQLLIDYDALVHQKNEQGQTPLFSAVDREYFDIARVLLKAGANINESDNDGNTLLHYAVKLRKVPRVNFALYHGADQTQCNKQGENADAIITQLGWNQLEACKESMETVFSAGKIILDDRECSSLELLKNDGYLLKQLLMSNAAEYCFFDITMVERVLGSYSQKLWKELQAPYSPYSPQALALAQLVAYRSSSQQILLNALCQKNFNVVTEILQKNPYITYAYENEDFARLLMIYCIDCFLYYHSSSFEYKVIKCLFYDGCFDLNVWDESREFFLSYMIKNDNQGKYEDLLKTGISVNLCDKNGKTALWYAILLKDKEKIRNLLLHGAVVYKYMLKEGDIESLGKEFVNQKCCLCSTHPDDMSNIPCVNRHIGNYICHNCYADKGAQCPLCKRSLDLYGR